MDPDLTIVLLGKAGVGKSAAGNTILGRKAFKSDFSFTSVTEKISVKTGRVFGKQISVVDTPGILDSKETRKKIKTYCEHLLKSDKPCLFLVVLSIGRFTEEDKKAVATAQQVLGCRGLKKSYLLFTNGDKLKGKSLEDFIFAEKDGKIPDVVKMFSGASHIFNNEDGDQEQVQDLLLKTGYLRDHQPLDPAAGLEVQRRMVLLGLPGAGKSSSGNTILGSERFRSAGGFNSVSTECVSESESVDGRLLQVVDTPGFTDEVLNPEQLCEEIMKTLVEASPGPHAFIIVVKIRRISAADQRLFELVPKLFGGDASKYTMVLFTHGDELRGRSMDQLIQSNRCVSDLVSMCDGRYCVFDNTQRGRRLQVRELLNKIDEMVAANGGQHYTSDMFRMAETFIREERNRADQSADSNRPDQSADSNRPDQSADSNRPDQSADSNRPDQSGGARGKPDNNSLWRRLIYFAIGFGVAGGVVGGVSGVVVGGVLAGVFGIGVGPVVAGAMFGLALRWTIGGTIVGVLGGVLGGLVGGVKGMVVGGVVVGDVLGWFEFGMVGGMVGGVVGGAFGGLVGGLVLAGKRVVNSLCKNQSNQSSRVTGDEQLSLRTRSREEGGRRLSEEP